MPCTPAAAEALTSCHCGSQALVTEGGAEGPRGGLRQLVSVNANTCWAKTGETCRESVAVLPIGFFSGKAAGILCRTGHWEPWLLLLCG